MDIQNCSPDWKLTSNNHLPECCRQFLSDFTSEITWIYLVGPSNILSILMNHSWQLVDTHIHQPVCVDAHACLTHTLQASRQAMWVRTWQGSMNNEGRCIIGNILKDITVMMMLMIICSTNPTRTSSRYTAIISTYSPYQMMATCGSMLLWQM